MINIISDTREMEFQRSEHLRTASYPDQETIWLRWLLKPRLWFNPQLIAKHSAHQGTPV